MSALDDIVKRHKSTCAYFQSTHPVWDCNCGADKAKAELEALRSALAEREARIAQLETDNKDLITWLRSMEWSNTASWGAYCQVCGEHKDGGMHSDECIYTSLNKSESK